MCHRPSPRACRGSRRCDVTSPSPLPLEPTRRRWACVAAPRAARPHGPVRVVSVASVVRAVRAVRAVRVVRVVSVASVVRVVRAVRAVRVVLLHFPCVSSPLPMGTSRAVPRPPPSNTPAMAPATLTVGTLHSLPHQARLTRRHSPSSDYAPTSSTHVKSLSPSPAQLLHLLRARLPAPCSPALSQDGPRPLGPQPRPQALERAASKVADRTGFGHAGPAAVTVM